jgi:ribose 5-phosphate isomerase A
MTEIISQPGGKPANKDCCRMKKTQDDLKRAVAEAALAYIPPDGIIGVGTGSTARCFIDALGASGIRVKGAVASSRASADRLRALGLPVPDLNDVGEIAVYVDGADEATERLELIKGGGGALTWEKVVATASRQFVCIVDESKLVEQLGAFPLPVEVLPMASSRVAAALTKLGGRPVVREGFVTDSGNLILDVQGLPMSDPAGLEAELDHIPGVVCNGLFARRPADVLLVGAQDGIRKMEKTRP